MIEQYAQSLAQYITANPHWGGLFTFLVSFLESLPVIGTIVPGSITMTAVGLLVGMGILPTFLTLFWAVLGAFLGDLLGYWLGKHYNQGLKNIWPFKSRRQWLDASENFFCTHGGKSIIVGRFVGPLRSFIPMIAGLLQMPLPKFIAAAIPSAALWAIAYMLPGFLLGALSLQLPPKIATKFVILLLLIIVLIAVYAWLAKYIFRKCKKACRSMVKRTWAYLNNHKQFHFIVRVIRSENLENYHQLSWLILAMTSFILFIAIFLSVLYQHALIYLNLPIFEFLRSLRHVKSDAFFVGVTFFGSGKVLAASSFFIIIWLLSKRYFKEACHFGTAVILGILTPNAIKYFYDSPRPPGLAHAIATSSFPSGHTLLSIMFYGSLAIILASQIKPKYRDIVYGIAMAIIFMVALSRLYLGAHWFTDVLASGALGYGFIALLALSYRRKIRNIDFKQLLYISLLATFACWLLLFTLHYHNNISKYALHWPSETIQENTWWGHQNNALPVYRQNRLGKPFEPLNIQYVGEINQLKHLLITQGFTANPDLTLLKSTIEKLTRSQDNFSTLLPSLYLNNPPVIYMVKCVPGNKWILKLWNSNVYMDESWETLYVGTLVQYQVDQNHRKVIYSFNVIDDLIRYLKKPRWHTNILLTKQFPQKLLKKHWEGKILQIRAPRSY